jgi:hypothetical protein
METVGGLRARFLHDSLRDHLVVALGALGWFDPDRTHRPVTFLTKPLHWSIPVEPNILALEFDSDSTADLEVGSALATTRSVAYVNIYAQDDSFGIDISNDVRDILRGRLAVPRPSFPIYNFQDPTPAAIGYGAVINPSVLRNAPVTQQIWLQHWFQVRCEVEDVYDGG